jgi:hypothetical protein
MSRALRKSQTTYAENACAHSVKSSPLEELEAFQVKSALTKCMYRSDVNCMKPYYVLRKILSILDFRMFFISLLSSK